MTNSTKTATSAAPKAPKPRSSAKAPAGSTKKASAKAPAKTAAKAAAKTARTAAKASPETTMTAAAPKAAVKAAAKTSAPRPRKKAAAIDPALRRHYIEVSAYYIAERRGFHGGRELEDWAQAEAEIDRLLAEGKLSLF